MTESEATLARKTQTATLTQFGYDPAGRLEGVTNGSYRAAYRYLANAPMVSQITFRSNTVTRMTTTKTYDMMNRLTRSASAPSGTGVAPVSFAYQYSSANQRTAIMCQTAWGRTQRNESVNGWHVLTRFCA